VALYVILNGLNKARALASSPIWPNGSGVNNARTGLSCQSDNSLVSQEGLFPSAHSQRTMCPYPYIHTKAQRNRFKRRVDIKKRKKVYCKGM
jgi:hypothetical protein